MTRGILVVGFVLWSLAYLLVPAFHREDWKGLAVQISQKKAVYMIPASSDGVKYYIPYIQIKDIRTLQIDPSEDTVTVIPYTTDIYGVNYQTNLGKAGFVFQSKHTVRGLTTEVWYRKAYPPSQKTAGKNY